MDQLLIFEAIHHLNKIKMLVTYIIFLQLRALHNKISTNDNSCLFRIVIMVISNNII